MRRFGWLVVIGVAVMMAVILFWGIWRHIFGSVPDTPTTISLLPDRILVLPAHISRWWDVPSAFIWCFVLTRGFGRRWGDNDQSIGRIIGLLLGLVISSFSISSYLLVGLGVTALFAAILGWRSWPTGREFGSGFGQGIGAAFGLLVGLFIGLAPGLLIGFAAQAIGEQSFVLNYRIRTRFG
jgi:hypothetical protein